MPDWYIESCYKIKYMFPKAHAAAYMIATLRLGWYKVHYPVEYYAAYFTVRSEDFDGATAVQGRAAVQRRMRELEQKQKEHQSTVKEDAAYSTFQIINEMLCRGIELLPVDLYKSDAKKFLVEDGKIRLPFSSLHGRRGVHLHRRSAVPRQGLQRCYRRFKKRRRTAGSAGQQPDITVLMPLGGRKKLLPPFCISMRIYVYTQNGKSLDKRTVT